MRRIAPIAFILALAAISPASGGDVKSPPGRIAFWSGRDGNPELYTMDADGRNARRLSFTTASEYGASWSPDGQRILFTSERDGNQEVYVANADGSGATNLTRSAAEEIADTWQPMQR